MRFTTGPGGMRVGERVGTLIGRSVGCASRSLSASGSPKHPLSVGRAISNTSATATRNTREEVRSLKCLAVERRPLYVPDPRSRVPMKVEKGDLVAVRYTGRLDNGDVFDSNEDGAEPLEFTVGAGMVIAGFETGVMGLGEGEARTVRVTPEEGYGPRDERLVTKLARTLFEDGDIEVGQHLDLEDEGGNVYHADVVSFDEQTVTVDLNHHLAGQTLTFDIRVEGIKRP